MKKNRKIKAMIVNAMELIMVANSVNSAIINRAVTYG